MEPAARCPGPDGELPGWSQQPDEANGQMPRRAANCQMPTQDQMESCQDEADRQMPGQAAKDQMESCQDEADRQMPGQAAN